MKFLNFLFASTKAYTNESVRCESSCAPEAAATFLSTICVAILLLFPTELHSALCIFWAFALELNGVEGKIGPSDFRPCKEQICKPPSTLISIFPLALHTSYAERTLLFAFLTSKIFRYWLRA